MKNYSRNNAGKGKIAFRTGDKWRIRKHVAVRNIKSNNLNKYQISNYGYFSDRLKIRNSYFYL